MGHECISSLHHTDYVFNSHVAINSCTNDGSKRNNQLLREMFRMKAGNFAPQHREI